MAGTRKPTAGLPRKEPDTKTVEGVAHDHGTGEPNHMHRLGDLPHLHGEDGKAILLDEHGRPLFTDEDQAPRAPDPITGSSARDYFNGDNAPEIEREQRQVETTVIAERRPDAIANGQPRPVAVSGAPGSRLADVTALVSTWTQLGFPVELQDELTQIQIAKLALDSMLEEIIRTRRHSDPALVASLLDAVDHIARARGLVRETGGGS